MMRKDHPKDGGRTERERLSLHALHCGNMEGCI